MGSARCCPPIPHWSFPGRSPPTWSPCSLDPAFGDGGLVVQPIGGFSAVDDLTVLPDGGPVVLATVGWKDHFRPIVLARFAADGHIDESFGIGGTAVFSKPDVDGRAVARTPAGDLVVVGSGSYAGGIIAVPFHGAPAVTSVTDATCTKDAALSPRLPVDFGSWEVGTRSTPRTFRLTATGTAPLRIDKVGFTVAAQREYARSPPSRAARRQPGVGTPWASWATARTSTVISPSRSPCPGSPRRSPPGTTTRSW